MNNTISLNMTLVLYILYSVIHRFNWGKDWMYVVVFLIALNIISLGYAVYKQKKELEITTNFVAKTSIELMGNHLLLFLSLSY